MFFYEMITLSTNGVLSSAYDFQSAFIANLIVSVSAGLVGGIYTVNLMEKWIRNFAFWKALVFIIVTYTAAALIISFLGALYISSENLNMSFLHTEVLEETLFFFGTWMFLKNYIIWLVIVLLTLIVLMVNDKYGPGVFPDYLMGRYFSPKKERRIFMFADLKNATGIAEELGEEKYFNFLKDFFKDIAPAIVQTRGEVYQYVGDEIVVTWKMKWGIKDANALRCFYSMKKILRFKAKRYMTKYNVVPDFRTGYHFGSVMVGEIGQIKRDIAFSGDVLNTTSRIQGLCSDLDVDILASKDFGDVCYKLPKNVMKQAVGKEKLRGKADEMELVTYVWNKD
ncbi:adenylate/guanylate cyclase domain-containing protein [Ulvibacter antarcticus]|nr:adenylate/guanylate cyclase domain-containing protein [Ulvibacter antarcticus]